MYNPWLVQPYATSGFLKARPTVLTTPSPLPSGPRLQGSRFFKRLLRAFKFFKLSGFQELFMHIHLALSLSTVYPPTTNHMDLQWIQGSYGTWEMHLQS